MRYFKLFILSTFCMPVMALEYEIDYFGLSFENDLFFNDDWGYTNGLIINWGYNDVPALDNLSLPTWISYLTDKTYLNTFQDRQYSIKYSVGQFIQTAIDIKQADLIKEDAPYVGLFAWQANVTAYDTSVLDELSLTFGIVGPVAGAKFIQEYSHNGLNATEPMGWDHQINNEVVFRFQAKRLWRSFVLPMGITEMDVITGVNAGIGNLLSDTNAGVAVRWGQQLQSSFSSSSPFSIQKLNGLTATPIGWYIFANISGSYVLNDIFIDGNTFTDSHSVDLVHWQAFATLGGQFTLSNWSFIYTLTYASDQYQSQSEDTRFGTVSVTYHF